MTKQNNIYCEIVFWLLLLILCYTGCSSILKDQSTDKPEVVRIIFDTDMGSDCDDAGALALLHSYADLGKAEIVGCIYSSGKVPYGAGVVQAINIYRGRPDVAVGAVHDTIVGDPVDKMNAEKLASDKAAFKNTIVHNREAPDQTTLTRQLLSGQEDNSVVYVTLGHTKGLHDLLISEPDDISSLNGEELIEKKVKRWIALGALGANNDTARYHKDWNFFFNGTAPYTKYLLDHFPSEIHFVDAGADVMTGTSLINTQPGNIVRTAYSEWLWGVEKKSLQDQRPSWDLATIYYAVEGEGKFLKNIGKGRLEFDVEKGCKWRQHSNGINQYLIVQRQGVKDAFADYLNAMMVEGER